jgi:hypothetical protein
VVHIDVVSLLPAASQATTPEAGQLFYPAECSHVFEKYWDHLNNPEGHPEFSQESEFTQGCMKHFPVALSRLDVTDFVPQVSVEAKQSDLESAEDAAISRLHQIHDGPDVWELHRSSEVTVPSPALF